MKKIFCKNDFSSLKVLNLEEYYKSPPIRGRYGGLFGNEPQTKIFISHKHNDIEEIKGVIGFLEKTYNVRCYIDELDEDMPENTNKETATRIKNKICACDKFVLLATNGAILSRWCNWELGFSDSAKGKNNIAIIHMSTQDDQYNGNEYYGLYPYITFCKKDNGKSDYYVIDNDTNKDEKLEIWLRRSSK